MSDEGVFHTYGPYEPDLTRPPLELSAKALTYHIRQEDLPVVHTPGTVPHVHITEADGGEVVLHALPGDTARDLVIMGLHYIALGVSLHNSNSAPGDWEHGWDVKHFGPLAPQQHRTQGEDHA